MSCHGIGSKRKSTPKQCHARNSCLHLQELRLKNRLYAQVLWKHSSSHTRKDAAIAWDSQPKPPCGLPSAVPAAVKMDQCEFLGYLFTQNTYLLSQWAALSLSTHRTCATGSWRLSLPMLIQCSPGFAYSHHCFSVQTSPGVPSLSEVWLESSSWEAI